jgi:thymidylate kinase
MGPRPLLELFESLDRSEVPWALLRGAERLGERTGDVDLLVDPAHVGALHRSALACGFVRWRAWRSAGQHPYTARDPDTGGWVSLHVTDRLSYGPRHELVTAAAGPVLDRRVAVDGVWVLAGEDELWVTLLHGLLDKGGVAEKHHARLRSLAAATGPSRTAASPVPAAMRDTVGPWPADRLVAAIAEGRWDAVDQVGSAWRRQVLGRPSRRVRRAGRSASLLGHRVRESVRERGTVVALLAPDGAGKSTLAAGLADAFAVPTRTVYLGVYGRSGPLGGRQLPPGVGLPVRLGWLLSRRLVVAAYRARRWVVVLDRHPIDAVATGGPTGRLGRWRRQALVTAGPRPDLVLVLDADGETLHRRKGEHDPATLDAAASGYRALAAGRDDVLLLDASAPAEEVRRRAVEAIWGARLAIARVRG